MGERRGRRELSRTTVHGLATGAGSDLAVLGRALRDAADALLAVLLAPTCLACGRPLDTPLAGPICEPCWRAVVPLPPVVCDRCGDPLPALAGTGAAEPCRVCAAGLHHLTRSRAAGVYDGTLRVAIHALKYDDRRSLARRLSALMRQHAGELLVGADAVVPVPLHPARHRARGFNQAADLARHLGMPVADVLRRVRATAPQAELPAAARHANVCGAFAASKRMTTWRGTILVLVDDVSTTGATLDACAGALLDAGASEVRAITAARAVKSRS